jgi:hypothetical protein
MPEEEPVAEPIPSSEHWMKAATFKTSDAPLT